MRAEAKALIDAAEVVTVLSGAGISTDSGIPDFRGPNGLWTKDPDAEKASNIDYYVRDAEIRRKNWARRAEGALWADVEPNAGHHALVRLQDRGKLHTLITQNVDELHQRAGIDQHHMVEIHGTTRKAQCLSCSWRDDIEVVLDRVRNGEPDPPCEVCGGLLKSATISFGQQLVAEDLERAEIASKACDVFLAVGSSLSVYPIAQAVPIAVHHGADLIIVNAEPTPFDDQATVVLHESLSETLPAILS